MMVLIGFPIFGVKKQPGAGIKYGMLDARLSLEIISQI
jgi:hypothetical protein